MKIRTIATFGVSALVMGTTMVGCASTKGPLDMAGISVGKLEKRAASEAADARKAIGRRQFDRAVTHAEAAVAGDPDNAAHRALLGKAYLSAGRFQSAQQALTDALTLAPGDGQVALNLALAQTALGDWDAARTTLTDHGASIDAADRGLALALAGDPMGGIQILGEAARDRAAPAKVRQKLALGLALAGKWQEAKAVAGIDLPPAEVDQRIMQWAAFAKPAQASDQVAALLRVTPVADQGQPVQLALNAPVATDVAVADGAATDGAEIDAFMPGPIDVAAEATESLLPVTGEPAPITETASAAPMTRFAPSGEIVQPLPAGYVAATRRSAPVAIAVVAPKAKPKVGRPATVASAPPFARGGYFVQLGAYDTAGVAKDAWSRLARRVPTLASLAPQGMAARTSAGSFYRLSVGGFARGDADRLCRQVRAKGGNCFVRTGAGETTAKWVRGAQVASR